MTALFLIGSGCAANPVVVSPSPTLSPSAATDTPTPDPTARRKRTPLPTDLFGCISDPACDTNEAQAATQRAYNTATMGAQNQQLLDIVSGLVADMTPEPADGPAALPWRTGPFTDAQLAEAKGCTFQDPLTSNPVSACELATLAAALARNFQNDPHLAELARQSYIRAVRLDPAFTLRDPLFYSFFSTGHVVQAPPISEREVVTMLIQTRDSDVLIDDANGRPVVHGGISETVPLTPSQDPGVGPDRQTSRTFEGTAHAETIQALRNVLTDLVPVNSTPNGGVADCGFYDSPFWQFSLVLDDGTLIQAATVDNYVRGGGPWYVTIGQQDYIQLSDAITRAFSPIAVEVGLAREPLSLDIAQGAGCEPEGSDHLLNNYYFTSP